MSGALQESDLLAQALFTRNALLRVIEQRLQLRQRENDKRSRKFLVWSPH